MTTITTSLTSAAQDLFSENYKGVIPRSLHDEVLRKSMSGQEGTEIAGWLKTEHGIVCGERTVRYLVQKYRERRAEIATGIFAKELVKTCMSDLSIASDMIECLEEDYHKLRDGSPKDAIAAANSLCKYLEYRKNLLTLGDEAPNMRIDRAVIFEGLQGKLGVEPNKE